MHLRFNSLRETSSYFILIHKSWNIEMSEYWVTRRAAITPTRSHFSHQSSHIARTRIPQFGTTTYHAHCMKHVKGNQQLQLLIHGPPGSGKTTVAKTIARECRKRNMDTVLITITGVAAKEGKRYKIHSYISIPCTPPWPVFTDGKYQESLRRKLKNIKVITADEASMINARDLA